MELFELIERARGDAPADLLLTGCRVVNVHTGEVLEQDIAIAGGRIAGVGPGYEAKQRIDLGGRIVCPGLIDAHVHVESGMVTPDAFARSVVTRGTTAVIADPHEIANVCGLEGIRYMLNVAAGAPIDVFVMASSCVPATAMETSGASLSAAEIASLRDEPRVLGLAEMMNFPGVVHGAPEVLAKLDAFAGTVIDGHAPGLGGKGLNAYVAAGIGSDHECVTAEEAREKMRLGMTIFIREGTAARNLEALLEAVTPETSHRSCFCTDDRHPATLLDEGHIDSIIRKAVHLGLEPVQAIRMATLNTALYFRLHDRGAIAPGKRADLVVFTDLCDLHAEMVFREGRLVARDGVLIGEPRVPSIDDAAVRDTVRVDFSSVDLTIPAKGERARVIGVVPGQIITEHLVEPIGACDGKAVAEPGRDILKIAVIERHKGTGRVGLGFVRGMGLTAGALATTVAHDHHNLIVAGADDGSMLAAARAVAAMGGGEAVARGEEVLATLPLPIAGLMSDRPLEAVRSDQDRLLAAAASLGSPLHDPFMTLSFLGLEVIPTLKLTDIGLVDVERFEPVGLWVEG